MLKKTSGSLRVDLFDLRREIHEDIKYHKRVIRGEEVRKEKTKHTQSTSVLRLSITNMASAAEDLTLEGVAESSENASKCTPAELLLKVVLAGTLSHYECRGMIDDKRLEHLLLAGKQILYKSHQESEVR